LARKNEYVLADLTEEELAQAEVKFWEMVNSAADKFHKRNFELMIEDAIRQGYGDSYGEKK